MLEFSVVGSSSDGSSSSGEWSALPVQPMVLVLVPVLGTATVRCPSNGFRFPQSHFMTCMLVVHSRDGSNVCPPAFTFGTKVMGGCKAIIDTGTTFLSVAANDFDKVGLLSSPIHSPT
jgi:hypothetical protein